MIIPLRSIFRAGDSVEGSAYFSSRNGHPARKHPSVDASRPLLLGLAANPLAEAKVFCSKAAIGTTRCRGETLLLTSPDDRVHLEHTLKGNTLAQPD